MNWKLLSASLSFTVFVYMIIRLLIDTLDKNYVAIFIDVLFAFLNYYFYLLNKKS